MGEKTAAETRREDANEYCAGMETDKGKEPSMQPGGGVSFAIFF